MEKYQTCGIVASDINKAGFSIVEVVEWSGDKSEFMVTVEYFNPLISHVEEYVHLLGGRLVALDAAKPTKTIPIETKFFVDSLTNDEYGLPSYHTIISINKKDIKSGFVLIGFKGIAKDESEEMETPPMFQILELTGKNARVITEIPYAGDDFFEPADTNTHFSVNAVRLQQIIGSWGNTDGEFKTDPNNAISFNIALTVDSLKQDKPSLILERDGSFSSTIDYSDFDVFGLSAVFNAAKSLKIGQNTAWECDNFMTGQPGQKDNNFIFSCKLKLTPVDETIDYKLILVDHHLLRLEVSEKVYTRERPDPNTGFIFAGGNVHLSSTLNFKRL
jgi:hypothetical protein